MFQNFLIFKKYQRLTLRTQIKILYINKIYYHNGVWNVIKIYLNSLNYYYLIQTQYINILTSLIIFDQILLISMLQTNILTCVQQIFDNLIFHQSTPNRFEIKNNFNIYFYHVFIFYKNSFILNWNDITKFTLFTTAVPYFIYLQYLAQQLNIHMLVKMPVWTKTPRWLKKFDRKKFGTHIKIYRIFTPRDYASFQRCLLKRLLKIQKGSLRIKYIQIIHAIATNIWNPIFYTLLF